jgi:tetratricopeptide (TPR) repeat protein
MRSSRRKHVFLAAALAVLLMHTVPWVVSNASQERTVEHLKRFIADDVHYSPGHLDGARLKSWGYLMELHLGDIEENERALRLRLEGKTDDVDGWLNLARVSHSLGKKEQARRALAVIDEYTPKLADRFKQMIVLYIELGDLEMAAKKLSLGIEWFPDDPDVYFLGGAVGQMTGDLYNAAMLYQMGVVLSPRDKDMILNYAEVLIDIGEYDDAREMLERASKLPTLTAADRGKIAAFRRRMGD